MLTLELIRNELFLKNTIYHRWTKSTVSTIEDPFISTIFQFLASYPETKRDYIKIKDNLTSHWDFCKGKLRSDGYYPLRNINEKIYYTLYDAYLLGDSLDDSSVIADIEDGYRQISSDFSTELHEESSVFKQYVLLENFYGCETLHKHILQLLSQKQFYTALAWMTIIAIFPIPHKTSEKMPDYTNLLLRNIFGEKTHKHSNQNGYSLHDAVEQFIIQKLNCTDSLLKVDLAFNHGLRWLLNNERNQLLLKMLARSERINILMPEYQIAEAFTSHIRKSDSYYVSSFVSPQKFWEDFVEKNSEKISLRISPLPILRQYIAFEFENQDNSAVYVGFYTYGGNDFNKSQFLIMNREDAFYEMYRNEYHYLWNISPTANHSTKII